MNALGRWYRRPVTVLALLIVVLLLSLFSLSGVALGPKGEALRPSFSVIIQHFGVDAETIEQTISIPLEDAISLIGDLEELRSTSEYGKSRVDVILTKSADRNQVYLALRDAVDRVYNQLPSSVQKPRILSSSLSRRPVFIVSFRSDSLSTNELRQYVEKNIKPSYEKIQGSGEIEIGGGELKEIHITVDEQKAAAYGLTVQAIASYIQQQNLLTPVGELKSPLTDTTIAIFGKLESLQELEELTLPVGESGVKLLGEVAQVAYGARELDTISRVDEEKRVVLYIQSSGSANLVTLSRELRHETAAWQQRGFQLDVILDSGRKIEESIYAVFKAILTGMVIVILFLSLFLRTPRIILILSLSIPLTGLVTTGLLAAGKLNLDQFALAGLAVGIGMIIDAGIVLTENIRPGDNFKGVFHIIGPLVSSTLTTIIVLIPLYFMEASVEGIRQVSVAIGLLLCVSLVLNILFVPSFAAGIKLRPGRPGRAARLFYRLCYRFSYRVIRFRAVFLGASLLLCLLLVLVTLGLAKDLSFNQEEDTIFAHLEFASGTDISFVDELTDGIAAQIRRLPGILRIQSGSRRGTSDLTIQFDETRLSRVALIPYINEVGRSIPGGFLYIPDESSSGERALEITLIGPEDKTLKELAHQTAGQLNGEPWITQTVLHFKEPPPTWAFQVDHQKAGTQGLTASGIATYLRWHLYGPVAVKWMEENTEIDLRVKGSRKPDFSIQDLERLTLPAGEQKYIALSQLGHFEQIEGTSKIYRKDRQRAVYLTVHTSGFTLEQSAARLWEALGQVPLPKGYAFEMDKKALELEEHFRFLWAMLALSILLIYMILASQAESLTIPFLILSIVPISLAFPLTALLISGKPITLPVVVGLIIISGIIVNNSILIVDSLRGRLQDLSRGWSRASLAARQGAHLRAQTDVPTSILFALRKRLRPLLLTSGTTILGTLPLLFFHTGGSSFMSTLAFIVFWGILGSIITSIFILPAVIAAFPGLLKSGK